MKAKNLGQKLEARPYHLHHDAFINEGQMVALQLAFPNASEPVAADESYLSCLCHGAHRAVYAGTSGRAAHVVASMLHGVTGFVFDLGTIKGAHECVAVLAGAEKLYAAVNSKQGGFFVEHDYLALPPDCMQEWWFRRTPFKKLAVTSSPIRAAVISPHGIFAADDEGLFHIDNDLALKRIAGPTPPVRLVTNADGTVYALGTGHLWVADNKGGRRLASLPHGSWGAGTACITSSPDARRLFLADSEGRLFGYHLPGKRFLRLGRAPLSPVHCLAVTPDGRLYGSCGAEIQHIFCRAGRVRDLGIAASVIGRRRYGYEFAAALAAPDGRLYFAEHDRGGHLWVYFPPLPRE